MMGVGFGPGAMMRGFNSGHMVRGFGENGYMMGSIHPVMGFVSLLILIGLVILLYKSVSKRNNTQGSLDALKLRFVKGEIDEQEFLSKKKVLKGK